MSSLIFCGIYLLSKITLSAFQFTYYLHFPLKVETLLALFTAESQVLKMAPQHDKHLTDTGWVDTVLFLGTPAADRGFRKLHQRLGPRSRPRSRPGQVLHCSHRKWKPRQQAFHSITDSCSQTRNPGLGKVLLSAQKSKYSKRNTGMSSKEWSNHLGKKRKKWNLWI